MLLNFVIIALFFIQLIPSFNWLWRQVRTPENIFHGVIFLFLLGCGCKGLYTHRRALIERSFLFHWNSTSFFICLSGCGGYLLNEYFTGIHVGSIVFMVMVGFGLLGFYVSREIQSRALIPCLLLVLILPFEGYLDISLGFPLRLFCAEMAGHLLQDFGVAQLTREAVILLENKAAVVELDCSGLKGIWSGLLFYLLLTRIENKSFSLGWFWGLLFFCLSLLAFNVLRIAMLVLVDIVWGQPGLAAHVHELLGIIGFVISCGVAWLLMKRIKDRVGGELHFIKKIDMRQDFIGEIAVMLLLLSTYYFHVPFRHGEVSARPLNIALPIELHAEKVALTTFENQFFTRNRVWAEKYTFRTMRGIRGSVVFVSSHSWKSQHQPQNCYQGQGMMIDYEETLMIPGGLPVKYLSLNGGRAAATYWFQSYSKETADYAARIYYSWMTREEPWVMTSILWNSAVDGNTLEEVITVLRDDVRTSLNDTI
ncbi:MAG: exosortase O [Desulfobulbaceae bacterium]|nr:exosortase O [Desulfobulbaceae bacterium]